MGQVLSYIWKCLRYETRKNLKKDKHNHLIDPLQEQQSHYITIPTGETEHVSSSNPENVVADLTPDIPCSVVDLGSVDQNDTKKEDENCVEHSSKGYVEENAEKLIQVVENKIIEEKEVVNKVSNELKGTSIKRIGQYTSKQKILLVGEGDFSFSASLAVAFGSASNIVATSLNSQDFLIENYGNFLTNKMELVTRGATVVHGVDVRAMVKDTFLSSLIFDRIIFNFPHAGKFGQSDSELRKHKELVRGFLRNAKKMINEDGEIHITHKSNGFYLKWDIPKIGSDQGL
ncbi:hypothetical protein RND81_14G173500 [Saponaria officinalis]|uniref:25S rRNA (uridine-N(3))-methyltransferase BMT5-like domain-containing protein n=1 Tax=Saponaria officinalis TaxID=3572 RepID=A0AAW1GXC4_SAPOF